MIISDCGDRLVVIASHRIFERLAKLPGLCSNIRALGDANLVVQPNGCRSVSSAQVFLLQCGHPVNEELRSTLSDFRPAAAVRPDPSGDCAIGRLPCPLLDCTADDPNALRCKMSSTVAAVGNGAAVASSAKSVLADHRPLFAERMPRCGAIRFRKLQVARRTTAKRRRLVR